MGVVTLGELKPSVSGRRTFRPSSSIRHATEWYYNFLTTFFFFFEGFLLLLEVFIYLHIFLEVIQKHASV
jgi:hypothetical protein